MHVLVTGGAGYIGSHTVWALKNRGYKIIVYDDLSTGFVESVSSADIAFVRGDIRDRQLLKEVVLKYGIEAIIHFAAKLVVQESVEAPIDYYDNNTYGVMVVAQVARECGVNKIVFSSTAATYGDASGDKLVNELSPAFPLNPYGWSKLMSERILKDSNIAYGIRSVILRYFNVAGASTDGINGQRTAGATHLIKVASEVACHKRSGLKIFGVDYPTPDGTCIRDYIHVEDLADIHVLSLEHLIKGGQTDIFNCGYGEGYSVKQVVEMVKKVSGVALPVEIVGRRPGDAASLVADSTKIRKIFGWTPKRNSLELICRSAYLWENSWS